MAMGHRSVLHCVARLARLQLRQNGLSSLHGFEAGAGRNAPEIFGWTKYAQCLVTGNLAESLFSTQFSWGQRSFRSKITLHLGLFLMNEPVIKAVFD